MIAPKLILLENKSWVQEKLATDPDYFQRFVRAQAPACLWIGCSDSRIPSNEITVTNAGELFVHRNVANQVGPDDTNVQSVVQYAVGTLEVGHVIVCGHYGCGGVRASLQDGELPGALGSWLRPLKSVIQAHAGELAGLADDAAREDRLVELNIIAQVEGLRANPVIREAWERRRRPTLHGWVYRMDDGQLRELVAIDPGVDPAGDLRSSG